MEDNFSTDFVGEDGSGGDVNDGEWVADEASLTRAHILLCGPVPNRPWTGTGQRPGGWGPLYYTM